MKNMYAREQFVNSQQQPILKLILTNIFLIVLAIQQLEATNKIQQSLSPYYAGKRVLITGGAGFIGSHIAHLLHQLHAKITILDNFSTGSLENISDIKDDIVIINGDIRSSEDCAKATHKQDYVFHLAAFISVPASVAHPELCMAINVEGTRNIIAAAESNKVKALIFSSTSAVYGDADGVKAENSPIKPLSPYAESKYQGELLCQAAHIRGIIKTGCLRYFNVYGPRQNPNGAYAAVVAKFTQQLQFGQELVIFGDGSQTRDFVPVSTVAQANLIMAISPELDGSSYNIATGKSITLLELAEKLQAELGIKAKGIKFMPARPGDIKNSAANCLRFQQLLERFCPSKSTK